MTKILVIEDENAIRENILETLELDGFETFGAPDGRTGVDVAHSEKPDLIICDIMMNEMNGYQVLEAVRQDKQLALTPFIFITARADRNSMRQGMELGADDYIIKPFTTAELINAIHMRLKRHKEISTEAGEELTAIKNQLVQVISHELKTPLTSINMATDLLSREIDALSPDELNALLYTLNAGSNRLNRVVEQMTLMLALRSGMLTSEIVSTRGMVSPTWPMMVAAINAARRFTTQSNFVDIVTNVHSENAFVRCDQHALRHAYSELITNALNYSPANGTVTISQWIEQGRVWISIADQGKGMSPDEIKQAMEMFSQVNRERNEQQGMGVGMTLAYQIVEVHDGHFEIRSTPGEGTEVFVGLPLSEAT